MTRLTLSALQNILDAYLAGHQPFSEVRRFVYRYYEAEDETVLDDQLTAIFPILAPYLEDEEARGDEEKRQRIRRLRGLLDQEVGLSERAVFALEFDKIQDLVRRFDSQLISRDVFEDEIRKLSPGKFDPRRIVLWATVHRDESEPNPVKMS